MDSARFYCDLPTLNDGLSSLLAAPSRFVPTPADWEVFLTDVRGSTRAVAEGRQHLVNLVATGSIIAALNLAHRQGLDLPFFFGGDGATLMAPPALAGKIASALALHRDNTRRQFDLDLRVGRVPVAEVYQHGLRIDLAKVDVNGAGQVLPIALGEGLQFVEKVIKGEDAAALQAEDDADLDLTGMECRWNSIRPPRDTQEVVCLLVAVRDASRQGTTLADVMHDIETIYGPSSTRSPISRARLRFDPGLGRVGAELRLRLGRFDLGRLLATWLCTILSPPYFAFHKSGRHYLERLVQLSNTLMIDGRLSTVIAGTTQQRLGLTDALRPREERGEILYGLEVCAASVMSCYVRDRHDQHIHFVDGHGGGYTRAATRLKAKMATTR